MDIISIKNQLYGETDKLIELLEHLNFSNISFKLNNNYIHFGKDIDSSPVGCILYIHTLKYEIYSLGENGDIFTLVQNKLNISFLESIRYVENKLKLNPNYKVKLPFNGLFEEIEYAKTIHLPKFINYNMSVLENYKSIPNYHFIRDGIDYETQVKFNIGYDYYTNRITIPHFDINGNLIGIMGRHDDKNVDKEYRFRPIINFEKSNNVYGLYQNYQKIMQKDTILIGESEKFVMQLASMDINIGVAVCKCNISYFQELIIKSLNVKNIILCFDEGINEEVLKIQCEKLKSDDLFYKNNVGYIFDKENKILEKDSKNSPSDLGFTKFKELMKMVKYI